MDLGLDEQQEMLRNFARDFLEKENPESLVRELEEDEKGYSPELWRKMAQQGWMGLIIPEQYGGSGLGLCELAVLLEEFGRVLVMGPYISTVVLAGVPIAEAGSEEQKQQVLPRLASGESIMTLALTEPSARWDAGGVEVEARKDGNDYVLNGTKLFVPDAHVADQILVAARTSRSADLADGITLLLVDARSPGVSIEPLRTIAGDKQSEVRFENARVPAANVIGQVDRAWPVIEKTKQVATVASCAYLVGLSAQDFDIAVNYSKERVQFGRPIGSFQALQHRMADGAVDVDSMRLITYKAAWELQEDQPDAAATVSVAKAWVSDASRRVVATGQQIHGGLGFTKDYKIQLYFRRQKWLELMWGDGDYHREQVAQALGI